MSNANESAFPQLLAILAPLIDGGGMEQLPFQSTSGLTKREEFAKAAMQGLLTQETPEWNFKSKEQLVEAAVRYADALLAELERKP